MGRDTLDVCTQVGITLFDQDNRRQKTIAYSDLVAKIKALGFLAYDPRLDELLWQISTDETGQGRAMLAVLVVHKTGDLRPGRGFFDRASALGLDTSDEDRLWAEQPQTVYGLVPRLAESRRRAT